MGEAKRKKAAAMKHDETDTSLPPVADAATADEATAHGPRVLTSLHGADDLDTPEKRQAIAEQIADDVIDAIEADRKAHGLPPLDP